MSTDDIKNAADSATEADEPAALEQQVGYGNPPMVRRFKGDSGNVKGRPRGSKNHKTIMREVANEMHPVVEDGKRWRRSTAELMLLALRNRAAQGAVRAISAYERYMAKYAPQANRSQLGYLVVPAPMTEEEAIEEAENANQKRLALLAQTPDSEN
jgi:hypothetical protein